MGNGKNRVYLQDLGIDGREIISVLRKEWQCVNCIKVTQDRTKGELL